MLSKIRKKKLEKNIWKFYLYRIFSSLMFTTPVFVLFYQANGLNTTQVMILQSVYTAIVMLAVIPSGIVADYIGRKKVLVANAVFFALAWFIFAISYGFWGFLIAESIIAVSSAMWAAAGNPFFYDNLRELGKEGSFKRLYGNVIAINSVSWGLSALVGGFIAVNNLRIPYWATVIVGVIALLITFSFTDTEKYKHGDKHYFTHLKNAFDFARKHPRIRLFMFYSAIMFAVGFAVFMFFQPYFQLIKVPLAYFGVIYLAMYGLSALGSKIAHRIEEYFGEKKILIINLVVLILCVFGMSRGFVVLGVVFPIIIFFNSGLLDPILADYLNKNIESHHRATVLSLHTLLTQLLTTVSAPFFGWVVDFWSLQTAFVMAAIILVIDLFILVGVFTMITRRENGIQKIQE